MYAFLILFGVLVTLFIVTNVYSKETFVGEVPLNTDTKLVIPTDKIPAVTSLPANPMPSDLPGPLPVAPYEQIGKNLPSPYKDPSLIKTTRQRILNALELVKGFLAFQATEIEDNSDPSIQLPLQTARADFKRLESEANVLQRNPGLTPQLTVLDIAQIEDNLAYLQREVELIGANRPFQSSQHDADLEGFVGTAGTAGTAGKVATETELMAFSSRIQQAIKDLSSSGTTDPIIQTRIGNLTGMKADIDAIVQKLDTGAIMPADVPVKAQDIENALPLLVSTSQPLPNVIQEISDGEYGDPNDLVGTIKSFLNSAKDMLSTSNFSFSVNYAKPTTSASTLTETGFPSPYDIHQVSSAPSLNDILSPDSVSDMWAMDPRAEGRTEMVGSFDWKKRAYDIVDQIQKRELNPADYGVMPLDSKVSKDFSWKGYTKMVCTRLQASSTFNLDELCGCPSAGWKGW